jgi:hypothetical protein
VPDAALYTSETVRMDYLIWGSNVLRTTSVSLEHFDKSRSMPADAIRAQKHRAKRGVLPQLSIIPLAALRLTLPSASEVSFLFGHLGQVLHELFLSVTDVLQLMDEQVVRRRDVPGEESHRHPFWSGNMQARGLFGPDIRFMFDC